VDFGREELRWYALIGAAVAISGVLLLVKHWNDGGGDSAGAATPPLARQQAASGASATAPRPASTQQATPPRSKAKPPAKPKASSAPSPKRTASDLPAGAWEATGIVTYVPPDAESTQPLGTVIERHWRFSRDYRGECRVVFTRTTLYGPSTTTLIRRGKRFAANFPPVDVPCAYPRGYPGPRRLHGESHESYVLWWEGRTQLRAVEHRSETGCYPGTSPPDVTRWRGVHR
jgi:hypothetical protein